jgi:hypothetical protein
MGWFCSAFATFATTCVSRPTEFSRIVRILERA